LTFLPTFSQEPTQVVRTVVLISTSAIYLPNTTKRFIDGKKLRDVIRPAILVLIEESSVLIRYDGNHFAFGQIKLIVTRTAPSYRESFFPSLDFQRTPLNRRRCFSHSRTLERESGTTLSNAV